jgi:hypothetical protein
MLLAQYALAQHVAGAGSQQVFGEHLIGEGRCVLPSAGLEPGYNGANSGRSLASRPSGCSRPQLPPEQLSGPPPALPAKYEILI